MSYALSDLPTARALLDEAPIVRAEALVVCGGTAVIDPANAAEVGAGIVIATREGTFAEPTVPALLAERGVLVVPDLLALRTLARRRRLLRLAAMTPAWAHA